jgi:photosystem II stability/assembly factor-like uncharacterized protein
MSQPAQQLMRIKLFTAIFLLTGFSSIAQNGWTVCNAPAFNSRIDDLFMVDQQTGYAVGGDGKIVKTIDGGNNWTELLQTAGIYCRSVEFINTQKGFVGGFPGPGFTTNILRRTTDGGATWTDLTQSIHPKARKGICGLAVGDENTIYGGGNWFQDSGYIIKSTDGGNNWSFIDMHEYASSIIDMYFLNKDTGFVTGRGPEPLRNAVILYTTDGGVTWDYTFYNLVDQNAYVWKIQRLTKLVWFAAIENLTNVPPHILKSTDGGKTWKKHQVSTVAYNIEGIGFINPMHGWTGGDNGNSFETKNGGLTWESIPVCPNMNRVFRLNDTTMLASGRQIWKYNGTGTYPVIPEKRFAWLTCHPNPVRDKDLLTMNVAIAVPTRVMVDVYDQSGRRVRVVENADKPKGSYQYYFNTSGLQRGIYYVVLKTHEDKRVVQVLVSR